MVPTTCPFCPCGCGLYFQRTDGTLAGVAPSERHPISRGTLCARGWAAHEAPVWGRRLLHPLIRRAGELQPATWDEAVARAAKGLLATVGAGRSVGVFGSARATNEENFLAVKLARGALQTPHIDTSLGWTYLPALRGFARASGLPAPAATLEDLAASDVILLMDNDVASTHPKLASLILHAVSAGAMLITMAHRRTQMARVSKLYVPLKPGLETEVLERLAAAVRSARTPGAASSRGGDGDIMEAARLLHRAKRPLAVAAPAPPIIEHEGPVGLLTTILAEHEASLAVGPRVLIVPSRANQRGAVEMGASPQHLPGLTPTEDHAARQRLSSVWQRPVCTDAGHDAASIIDNARAVVVVADDPITTLRSPDRAAASLQELDCLVVLDSYLTATAALAEVVLPVATPGETDGTMTNLEGRVQAAVAAAAPPGEARPAWRALADLMSALGAPADYDSAGAVRREIGAAIPAYARAEAHGGFQRRPDRHEWKPVEPDASHSLTAPPAAEDSSFVLTLDSCFDWAADPLVRHSPSLSRQYASGNRLYPRGFAEMAKSDAATLGVRTGWNVKLATENAEVVLPVVLRDDLPGGTLIAPFAFRGIVSPLLGNRSAVAVNVQRA